jgi:hypothetical protein
MPSIADRLKTYVRMPEGPEQVAQNSSPVSSPQRKRLAREATPSKSLQQSKHASSISIHEGSSPLQTDVAGEPTFVDLANSPPYDCGVVIGGEVCPSLHDLRSARPDVSCSASLDSRLPMIFLMNRCHLCGVKIHFLSRLAFHRSLYVEKTSFVLFRILRAFQ